MVRPISRDMSQRLERFAAVVMLLTKAPRTCKQIVHFLGMPASTTSTTYVNRFLQALEEEGLIEMEIPVRKGSRGRPARVWHWVAQAPTQEATPDGQG